ncbi:hypothetical protein, partial [[Eubacterium] cellulosolvens]
MIVSIFLVTILTISGIIGVSMLPARAEVKGPDYYGYSWEDEIPYFWEEINNTGTLITASDWVGDEDDGYYAVALPVTFDFNFYGTNEGGSNIYIGTNGQLSFSTLGMTGSNSRWNRRIPYYDTPNRLIAAFWDDFEYIDGRTEVYYEILGSGANQYLVVEY